MPRTRTALAVTAGAAALLVCAASPSMADPPEPPRHVAQFFKDGADGRPHEAFCPAMQHVYSGGFTVSAGKGARLAPQSADVVESRPNDHAAGWIVTVHKSQVSNHAQASPADLTIHLACTDDTMSHGA
ncbi:hypothetical protein ACIPSA_50480 [Streptomyces sp. NPDC086549]|uniref:hypothetical protein n=1 Tax=Streptomyces sp. NPDC086549 TaxID=3365752 RepID=UPI00380CD32E